MPLMLHKARDIAYYVGTRNRGKLDSLYEGYEIKTLFVGVCQQVSRSPLGISEAMIYILVCLFVILN